MPIAGLQLTSRQPCWGTTTKRFPPLGTKLFYHANSAKKFFIVLTTNMAALSRGCKRSIQHEKAHRRWEGRGGQRWLTKENKGSLNHNSRDGNLK